VRPDLTWSYGVELEWDEPKRQVTLELRGLDFDDARTVFSGKILTLEDDRLDYGETRYQTIGELRGKIVMIVWTSRGERRRIISMRVCNEQERRSYAQTLAGRG
jgi:uncharacterized DUF497 family protein